jgi:hypothetical protein
MTPSRAAQGLVAAVAAILALLPSANEACAGRVYHRKLGLKQALERPDIWVVLGEFGGMTRQAMNFRSAEFLRYPESLVGASDFAKEHAGRVIVVHAAYESLHKEIRELARSGVGKSWQEEDFNQDPVAVLEARKKYVLFVVWAQRNKTFELAANDAFLSAGQLDQVRRELASGITPTR